MTWKTVDSDEEFRAFFTRSHIIRATSIYEVPGSSQQFGAEATDYGYGPTVAWEFADGTWLVMEAYVNYTGYCETCAGEEGATRYWSLAAEPAAVHVGVHREEEA